MDYFAMKRRELQELCKKHKIRANMKNLEMAEALTLLLHKKDEEVMSEVEKPVEKQLGVVTDEMVVDLVESPKAKKVRFSPLDETFYFVATDKDSDSDSDCGYSLKKKKGGRGRRKSVGKEEVSRVAKSAREVEVVEIKDTSVCVTRSRKQKKMVVLSGHGEKGVMIGGKRVRGQKECEAIVVHKGKEVARDDARKRTRASQVVPSVEAVVENEVLSPKPLLRRSKRRTMLSSVAGSQKELGEAVETVKLAIEPVIKKSCNAAKPGRRSNRNVCKKVPAEISDDISATAIDMDGLMKENQEPFLLEESSLVVYESLDRSPVAAAEKELELCEAVEMVKLARESFTRKSSNVGKPGRRSNRNACKKVPAETSDDIAATAVEEDGVKKGNQDPSLLEESAVVQFESLDRSAVPLMGKELKGDVNRKQQRKEDCAANSKVYPSSENDVLSPKGRSRRSDSKTAVLTELSMPAEITSLHEEPAGNENETDSCFNNDAVEKSRKKRKGSSKKIESAAKNQPVCFTVSIVDSHLEKNMDTAAHMKENQLVESLDFQGTSMFHEEQNAVQPVVNHMASVAVEDAIFSKSSMHSNSTVDVMDDPCLSFNRKDTDQGNTVEQNPLASPDKLSSVEVSFDFSCIHDVQSITYQPECEGQTSSLLDLNEQSETEELLIVTSISRGGGVVDDQSANGVSTSVPGDQKSMEKIRMVQVEMDFKKPAEAAAETVGGMHMSRTVSSYTTLTPLNSSVVKRVGNEVQVPCSFAGGINRNVIGTNFDDSVHVTEDSEEIYEVEFACGESSKVVPADNISVEELGLARIKATITEEANEGITKSSNFDESAHSDLHKTDGQVAVDKYCNKGNASVESKEKFEAQMSPTVAEEVHEDIENGSNLMLTDGQVADDKFSNEINFNAPKESKENCEHKSSNGDKSSITLTDMIVDELESGTVPVVLESDGDLQSSSSCGFSRGNGEYELGGINRNVIRTNFDDSAHVTEDSEEYYENESAYGERSKVVPADDESVEESGIAMVKATVIERVNENTEKSSNWDEIALPDFHNADGQVAENEFLNEEGFVNASEESTEKCEALDIVQTSPTAAKEVHGGIEKRSNLYDSVLPDLLNTDGQVVVDKLSNEKGFGNASAESKEKCIINAAEEVHEGIEKGSNLDDSGPHDSPVSDGEFLNEGFVNASETTEDKCKHAPDETEERCEHKSTKGARNPITLADRIMDEGENGTMPVVSKSDGNAETSSSCRFSCSDDKYELGDIYCSTGDKTNLKEEEIIDEDLGNDCLDMNAAFQEDEENKEGDCEVGNTLDAMHDSSVDTNATSKGHSEELLNIQKEGILPGVSKQDVGENSDGHMEVNHSDNAMDPGNSEEVFEKCDQHADQQSMLEDNKILKEQYIVSAMIQEYVDAEQDRNKSLEVRNFDLSILEERFSETYENQKENDVTGFESQDKRNLGSPDNCKQISSKLEKCASAALSDSICRDDKTPERNLKGKDPEKMILHMLVGDSSSTDDKSSLQISDGNNREYTEDLRNVKESTENSQVIAEELNYQEHKVMGEVVELESTLETSNHCHIGAALMDSSVCIPSDSEVKPLTDSEVKSLTDNTCSKLPVCSGGAVVSVFNVSPSVGNLCVSKERSMEPCLGGQPPDKLRVSEDLEAHTSIDGVMLIEEDTVANSLLSFGCLGPKTVSPEKVVRSLKINMAAQAGIEVLNSGFNEASSSKDFSLDEHSKCNLGDDVLVCGSRDNIAVADKVSAGSTEAIIGIKDVGDGDNSVEKTLQRLDGDSLSESEERNFAYVNSFSDISHSRTESDFTLALHDGSLSCGVFEKRHQSVQEGSESIYLKPGRVSGLKFECPTASIDGFADTPVSGSRHEIRASENIASPLVNSLGMNWLFEDDVEKLDPEMSNAISSSEDVNKGNGGVTIPQVGAGKLSEHKHQYTQELGFHCPCSPVTKFPSHDLDSIGDGALEAELVKCVSVSTTARPKKRDNFIPRTPKNLINMSDMKENYSAIKTERVTNISVAKSLHNRRALEDLQNK